MIRTKTRAGLVSALAALVVAALAMQLGMWRAAQPAAQQLGLDPTTCSRDIEYRGLIIEWTFDPCIEEGAPLPLDVEDAMYEDWLDSTCQPPPPSPSDPPTASPTESPIESPTPP